VSYRYAVDCESYRVKTSYAGGCGDIKASAASTVFYSPDDPVDSTLHDPQSWIEMYGGGISCFFFGAVFTTFGLVPAIGEIRARRPAARRRGRRR